MDGGVLFYHFELEQKDGCSASQAWKAILCQLVHICRTRKDVIDVLSILHTTDSTGQITASDDEVKQTLALLLSQLTDLIGLTLLFDGIDECTEPSEFLLQLHSLCLETSTKALLLGRSNIDIPAAFKRFKTFDLVQAHNSADIARYLTPRIQSLQSASFISPEPSLGKIVATLVDRSCGMFLWAALMIRYLQCKALTPRERREAIFSVEVLEGIDGLYCTIL
jgi:hypothetical protein